MKRYKGPHPMRRYLELMEIGCQRRLSRRERFVFRKLHVWSLKGKVFIKRAEKRIQEQVSPATLALVRGVTQVIAGKIRQRR